MSDGARTAEVAPVESGPAARARTSKPAATSAAAPPPDAPTGGGTATAAVLGLQRAAGNQAVVQRFTPTPTDTPIVYRPVPNLGRPTDAGGGGGGGTPRPLGDIPLPAPVTLDPGALDGLGGGPPGTGGTGPAPPAPPAPPPADQSTPPPAASSSSSTSSPPAAGPPGGETPPANQSLASPAMSSTDAAASGGGGLSSARPNPAPLPGPQPPPPPRPKRPAKAHNRHRPQTGQGPAPGTAKAPEIPTEGPAEEAPTTAAAPLTDAAAAPPPPPPPPPPALDPAVQEVIERVTAAILAGSSAVSARTAAGLEQVQTAVHAEEETLEQKVGEARRQVGGALAGARRTLGTAVTTASQQLTDAEATAQGELESGFLDAHSEAEAAFDTAGDQVRELGRTKGDTAVQTGDAAGADARTQIEGLATQARNTGNRRAASATSSVAEAIPLRRRAAHEIADNTANEITRSLNDVIAQLHGAGVETQGQFATSAADIAAQLLGALPGITGQLEDVRTQAQGNLTTTFSTARTNLDALARSLTEGLATFETSVRGHLATTAREARRAIHGSGEEAVRQVRAQEASVAAAGTQIAASIIDAIGNRRMRREAARILGDRMAADILAGYGSTGDQAAQAMAQIAAAFGTATGAAHESLLRQAQSARQGAAQTAARGRDQLLEQVATVVRTSLQMATSATDAGRQMAQGAGTNLSNTVADISGRFDTAIGQLRDTLAGKVREAVDNARHPLDDLDSRIDDGMHRAARRLEDSWLSNQWDDITEGVNWGFVAGLIVGLLVTILVIAICGTGIGALILAGALAGALSVAASTLTEDAIHHRPTDWGQLGVNMLWGAALGAVTGAVGGGLGATLGTSVRAVIITEVATNISGVLGGVIQNVAQGHPWDQGLLLNLGTGAIMSGVMHLGPVRTRMEIINDTARGAAIDRGLALNVREGERAAITTRQEERAQAQAGTAGADRSTTPAGTQGGGETGLAPPAIDTSLPPVDVGTGGAPPTGDHAGGTPPVDVSTGGTAPTGDHAGGAPPTGEHEGGATAAPAGEHEGGGAPAPTGDHEGGGTPAPAGEHEGGGTPAPTGEEHEGGGTPATGEEHEGPAAAATGEHEGGGAPATGEHDQPPPVVTPGDEITPVPGGEREVIPPDRVLDNAPAPDPSANTGDRRLGPQTPDQIRNSYGMPEQNQQRIQAVAERLGVEIEIRPTTEEAPRLLEQGALPKPEDIKAKTINAEDTHLGAREQDIGQVGFFEPELPERPPGMSDAQWARIEQRYVQRVNEFHDFGMKMAELSLPVGEQTHTSGRYQIRVDEHGVVHTVSVDGVPADHVFTGDHDVFNIRNADGSPLTPERYQQVVDALVGGDMGVQHGAHLAWEPHSPIDWGIFRSIVERHGAPTPGRSSEPLLSFGPGREPNGQFAQPGDIAAATARAEAGVAATTVPSSPAGGDLVHGSLATGVTDRPPPPEIAAALGDHETPTGAGGGNDRGTGGPADHDGGTGGTAAPPEHEGGNGGPPRGPEDGGPGGPGGGDRPFPADLDVEGAIERGLSPTDADARPYVDETGQPQQRRPDLTLTEASDTAAPTAAQGERINAATAGDIELGLPHPAELEQARARFADGTATPADVRTLLEYVVGELRGYAAHEGGVGGLTGEQLCGRCMMARDITALSLRSMLGETGVPATIRRYSVDGVAGRTTGQSHQFTVVEFRLGPDHVETFIIDPTYAQFVGDLRTGGPLQADVARGTAGGSETMARLLEDGYIPLNDTTAFTYMDSLIPAGATPPDVTRLLQGEGGIHPQNIGPSTHLEAGQGAAPLAQQLENLPYVEVGSSDFLRAAADLRRMGRPDLAHLIDELRFRLDQSGIDNPRGFTPEDFGPPGGGSGGPGPDRTAGPRTGTDDTPASGTPPTEDRPTGAAPAFDEEPTNPNFRPPDEETTQPGMAPFDEQAPAPGGPAAGDRTETSARPVDVTPEGEPATATPDMQGRGTPAPGMSGGDLAAAERILAQGDEPHPVDPALVQQAIDAQRQGGAAFGPAQQQVLIRAAVEEVRAQLVASQVGREAAAPGSAGRVVYAGPEGLSAKVLSGACGAGRDISIQSLASMSFDAAQPVSMQRFQAGAIGLDQRHGFAVVSFGETRYIVDPTYGQFLSPEGHGMPGRRTPADRIRGTEGGDALISSLVNDGFVPLNEATARLYLESLSDTPVPIADPMTLLTGTQQTLLPGQTLGSERVTVGGPGGAQSMPFTEESAGIQLYDRDNAIESVELGMARARANGRPDLAEALTGLLQRLQAQGVPGSD